MIILGLVILVAAVAIGVVGVLSNSGSAHEFTGGFSVFDVDVTGSTGTLFLCGIVVGAAALFGLGLILSGTRRTTRRHRATHRGREQAPARVCRSRTGTRWPDRMNATPSVSGARGQCRRRGTGRYCSAWTAAENTGGIRDAAGTMRRAVPGRRLAASRAPVSSRWRRVSRAQARS